MQSNTNAQVSKNCRLFIIKLGGSLITDKSAIRKPRPDVILSCWQQIASALAEDTSLRVIVAHGQGSYAHVPAKKYLLSQGMVHEDARMGYAKTSLEVRMLHQLVLELGIETGLPVVSFLPNDQVVAANDLIVHYYTQSLELALNQGFVPVSSGDMAMDMDKGCSVISADTILPALADRLHTASWPKATLIHATLTEGVLQDPSNPDLGHIPLIESHTSQLSYSNVTSGADVTGGMAKKVAESVKAAQSGYESLICNPGTSNLLNELLHGTGVGTRVK